MLTTTKHNIATWFSIIIPVLLLLGVAAYVMLPDTPLRLVTQVYPPYQDGDQKRIFGSSVETMKCALEETGHPYTIRIVRGQAWAEAQDMVRAGDEDGFFGALHTQGRDEYALWSTSIDINKTYFVKLKNNQIGRRDLTARWGVKKGSGISSQVEGTALNIGFYGDDNPEVVGALMNGKIDFIYMDLNIFRWSVSENDVNDELLQQVVGTPEAHFQTKYFDLEPVADQLYGAYISRKWLRSHPGYMDKLNTGIGVCRQRKELSDNLPKFKAPRLGRRRPEDEEDEWHPIHHSA